MNAGAWTGPERAGAHKAQRRVEAFWRRRRRGGTCCCCGDGKAFSGDRIDGALPQVIVQRRPFVLQSQQTRTLGSTLERFFNVCTQKKGTKIIAVTLMLIFKAMAAGNLYPWIAGEITSSSNLLLLPEVHQTTCFANQSHKKSMSSAGETAEGGVRTQSTLL